MFVNRTHGVVAATLGVLIAGGCTDPAQDTDLRPEGPPDVLADLVMTDASNKLAEKATYCRPNDNKRPELVGLPDATTSQICPTDKSKGAASAQGTSGTSGSAKPTVETTAQTQIVVRQLNVSSVKMVSSSCSLVFPGMRLRVRRCPSPQTRRGLRLSRPSCGSQTGAPRTNDRARRSMRRTPTFAANERCAPQVSIIPPPRYLTRRRPSS